MSSFQKNCFAFIAISIILVAIYFNSFQTVFHFDDGVNILKNKYVHLEKFNWQGIKRTFFAGGSKGDIYHPTLYRPVAMFSFAMNYYFGMYEVFGYHLVNLIVHITATIFLFLFINQALNTGILKARYGEKSYSIALLATLLWATNPVQLQSVTYIVQRMASMAGMFYLMAMYFYLKGRVQNRTLFYVIAFIAGILSVGSKENAIILPFSILFFDLFIIEGITRKNVKCHCMLMLWIILLGILLIYALSGPETFSYAQLEKGYAKRDFTLGERLLTQPRVLFFYLSLLALPLPGRLTLTHTVFPSRSLIDPVTTLLAILGLALIITIIILKAKKWPLLTYCILFYFLNHLIEAGFFPLEMIYEHRNYIPSMLIFVPVAVLAVKVLEYSKRKSLRYAVIGCLAFILLNQGNTVRTQNDVWRTEAGLWTHAMKVDPNPRAIFNLGGSYFNLWDWKQAKKYWGIVAHYNEVYGTNYAEGKHALPYGLAFKRAARNVKVLNFFGKLGGDDYSALEQYVRFKNRRTHRYKRSNHVKIMIGNEEIGTI